MLEVIKSIVCELTGYILKVVEVAHNDSGSRKVKCLLRSGGELWMVPEGVSVAVGYTLPDGTPGLYDTMPDGTAAGTVDGSTVTVQLSDAILSASGAVDVAVELRKDGAKLHTFPFRVNVIGGNPLSNPETFPALGAAFEGLLLYGGPGGTLLPLKLGPGLSIRDGVLYVSGGTDEPETPVGVVETTVDENGTLRVCLDGVEIIPVVDDAGTLTWPGLLLVVGDDGGTTLVKED